MEEGRELHVSWEDIPGEEARRGVHRKAIATPDVMLVRNECEPGMQVRPHAHPFEQVALFLEGRGILHVDGREHHVGPGSVVVIPPGAEHHLEPVGDATVVNLDVFAPARADYGHLVEWMFERPPLSGHRDEAGS